MSDTQGMGSCTRRCWIMAAVGGLLVALLFGLLLDFSFFPAVLIGLIFGLVLGFLLLRTLCTDAKLGGDVSGTASASGAANTGTASTGGQGATASAASTAGTAAAASTAGVAAAAPVAAAAVAPEAAAAPAPASNTDAPAAKPVEDKPAAKAETAPAKAPAAKTASAAPAATAAKPAKAAAKPKPAAKAKPAPTTAVTEGVGSKPKTLDAAREGGPDDLKQIKGVGPAMETMLHSMGFFHFDQIADWGPDEVAWVDQNLKGFKGRATRDAWVDQAKTLAAGGTTEFSSKVKKGGVY